MKLLQKLTMALLSTSIFLGVLSSTGCSNSKDDRLPTYVQFTTSKAIGETITFDFSADTPTDTIWIDLNHDGRIDTRMKSSKRLARATNTLSNHPPSPSTER